jgi:hypothetical protein
VRLEGLGKLKKSNAIWIRNLDLPAQLRYRVPRSIACRAGNEYRTKKGKLIVDVVPVLK